MSSNALDDTQAEAQWAEGQEDPDLAEGPVETVLADHEFSEDQVRRAVTMTVATGMESDPEPVQEDD